MVFSAMSYGADYIDRGTQNQGINNKIAFLGFMLPE